MNERPDKTDELDRLRHQDATAFTRLVAAHQSMILGLCQSLGLAGADRDDAAAEAFAAVFRAIPGFDGRAALSTWIYRIAWRTLIKARTRVRAAVIPSISSDIHDPSQHRPDDAMESSETNDRIWAAVASLEPRQAAAVEMFYRRDMGVDEIAAVLECPPGTVKTLLFRARERLREVMVQQEIVP